MGYVRRFDATLLRLIAGYTAFTVVRSHTRLGYTYVLVTRTCPIPIPRTRFHARCGYGWLHICYRTHFVSLHGSHFLTAGCYGSFTYPVYVRFYRVWLPHLRCGWLVTHTLPVTHFTAFTVPSLPVHTLLPHTGLLVHRHRLHTRAYHLLHFARSRFTLRFVIPHSCSRGYTRALVDYSYLVTVDYGSVVTTRLRATHPPAPYTCYAFYVTRLHLVTVLLPVTFTFGLVLVATHIRLVRFVTHTHVTFYTHTRFTVYAYLV